MMLSLEMGYYDFTTSNGCLETWHKWHGVRWAVLCGEAAEIPADAVTDWTVCLLDVTAAGGLSAAGDNLQPLVFGKLKKHHAFWGIDKAALPVTYRVNKKALVMRPYW